MTRYLRKVIRITAEDSPNVKRGLLQRSKGQNPDNRIVVPGVLTWGEYQERRATWDAKRQSEGLDAQFWKGKEVLLFPPEWLRKSADKAIELEQQARTGRLTRRAKGLGIDPGEGGDKTAWCVVDELGVLELIAMRTPDTTVVVARAFELMRKWQIPADRVCYDRGGGGYEHACNMRLGGANVRTVEFGGGLHLDPKRGMRQFGEKVEFTEEKYAYVNNRARMYHEASLLLDPTGGVDGIGGVKGWAIPRGEEPLDELQRQLGLMPKLTDAEGRYRMLPKQKQTKGMPDPEADKDEDTLIGLIGHSPDESDAFVLAIHAMLHKRPMSKAGAL